MFSATVGAFAYSYNVGAHVVSAGQEKQYKTVATKDVPVVILKEIIEKYPGYKVTAAGVSEDKEYKLNVSDGKTNLVLFYTASGEFVKEQK